MNDTLLIDELVFELRRSNRRKTIGITVDRGGELIVVAPDGVPLDRIEKAVRDKRYWVYGKLAIKEALLPGRREVEFVTGETLYYLGRSYRIKRVRTSKETAPLRLIGGRFLLRRDEQSSGREHLVRWYIDHGQPWIERRVHLMVNRFGATPLGVKVQDLGFRWGSCSKGGNLNFHWRVAQLPPRIIEYVVAHELVHLRLPHHTPEFWQSLERSMPDFAQRRAWLAENGARF
jgi:hypothetical protein